MKKAKKEKSCNFENEHKHGMRYDNCRRQWRPRRRRRPNDSARINKEEEEEARKKRFINAKWFIWAYVELTLYIQHTNKDQDNARTHAHFSPFQVCGLMKKWFLLESNRHIVLLVVLQKISVIHHQFRIFARKRINYNCRTSNSMNTQRHNE